jgi:hypothetical protein
MDIEHVIRRWTAGEAIRAIARATGLDRQTVRGLIRLAKKTGLKQEDTATEEQLQLIQKSLGHQEHGPEPVRRNNAFNHTVVCRASTWWPRSHSDKSAPLSRDSSQTKPSA